jgi:diguanylate cyclase (GGDEF)-like protein
MLWYVAVIAALNLGLGYLWAVRTRTCPRCARRRATELLVSQSATTGRPAATRAAAPPPVAAADAGPPAVAETAAATPVEAKSPSSGGGSALPSLESVDWGEMCQRYFSGLNAYRGELTAVNQGLDASPVDAEQVTQCADRLRMANDSFIGVANAAIGQLDAGPVPLCQDEADQTKLKESVRGQLEFAANSKSELDQLDIAADPTAARTSLRKTTEQLHESTDELFEEVQACLASARAEFGGADREPDVPPVPRDPATGLVTREHVEFLLEQLVKDEFDDAPVTVALLELDRSESADAQDAGAINQRLLRGVSNIVQQSLAADQTAARFSDQQLLLLVPHEDVNQVIRRAEEMRQRVASTEFMADGRTIKTTVTCALTEISPERSAEKLFEFLEEAVAEAKRYGGNRTFTHDGSSPSPIVPPELTLAPQQLAI